CRAAGLACRCAGRRPAGGTSDFQSPGAGRRSGARLERYLCRCPGTFFPVVPYTLDPGGVLAGGHLGFNYQIGALVRGAEADLEASNLPGDTTIAAFNQTYFFNVKADTLASARGRVGWAHESLLLYATGGVAWGHVTTPPLDTLNGWRTGWTAGA